MTEITELLRKWSDGDAGALNELVPLVYPECHRIASRQMSAESADITLQPTALVHEAYLKLVGQHSSWQNRAQFFALVARLMRRILVDHARARFARKRDARLLLSFDAGTEVADAGHSEVLNLLDLDRALETLEKLDAQQFRIVELRFFAGLTVEETARVVGLSPRTVKREWQLAKGWLYRQLNET